MALKIENDDATCIADSTHSQARAATYSKKKWGESAATGIAPQRRGSPHAYKRLINENLVTRAMHSEGFSLKPPSTDATKLEKRTRLIRPDGALNN